MRRFLIISLPALALAALPAAAQQSTTEAGQQQIEQQPAAEAAAPAGDPIIVEQEEGQLRAERIIGAPVMAGSGEGAQEIGTVKDLLFDENLEVVAAVVGVGGFLGLGEKSVALAWNALEMRETEEGEFIFSSSVSREELEQAPAFLTVEAKQAEEERAQQMQQQQMQQPQAPAQKPLTTE